MNIHSVIIVPTKTQTRGNPMTNTAQAAISEKAAGRDPEIKMNIRRAAVLGAGTMGAGIAASRECRYTHAAVGHCSE
jgi:hypothetical protein